MSKYAGKASSRMLLSSLLLLVLTLAGCSTTVEVEGTIPTPLVQGIPVRIGVHYSEEFRTKEYKEIIKQRGTWRVNLGRQNFQFFRNLIGSMFEEVKEVPEPPLSASELEGLDGVLVPEIKKYGFLTPEVSGLKFYSASIQYQLTLYDAENRRIGQWDIVGYGKSEASTFGQEEALEWATEQAIRDGGARIAIELSSQPEVISWLESLKSESGG